jgi:hypothetical protein
VQKDLPAALKGVEALILAVRHAPYLELKPDDVVKWAGGPIAVVDCFGILEDKDISRYELGCEVKALGRGHPASRKKFALLKLKSTGAADKLRHPVNVGHSISSSNLDLQLFREI